LREFTPELQEYVRKQQYANETFKIELHPKPNELPVKMGDLIALSEILEDLEVPHCISKFVIQNRKNQLILLLWFDLPDTKNHLF
jgi:hypothetical protein